MLCCKGELWSPWRRSITFFYPQPKTVEGVWEGVCVFGNMTKGEKVEGVEGRWRRGCADLRPPRPSVGSCPMERKHHLPQFPLFLEFSQPGWMFEMFDTSACHQWKHQWDKSISSLLPKECRQFSPLAFNEQIWDGFVPHLGKLVAEKTPPKNISNHPMPMVQLTKCSFFLE